MLIAGSHLWLPWMLSCSAMVWWHLIWLTSSCWQARTCSSNLFPFYDQAFPQTRNQEWLEGIHPTSLKNTADLWEGTYDLPYHVAWEVHLLRQNHRTNYQHSVYSRTLSIRKWSSTRSTSPWVSSLPPPLGLNQAISWPTDWQFRRPMVVYQLVAELIHA